ncbi:hypothetical protein E1166_10700 [Micromonospora sp. KC213]|nr:hypothetical protein E1166_10700 [Micromonospora sp. KC213]
MKHHRRRQLRRLTIGRPYQLVAGSAAALVLATGTGVLVAGADQPPTRHQTSAAVIEAAPRLADVASRSHARAAVASPSPSASPSPPATARPSATPRRTADPDLTRTAAPKPPASKVLDYDYQAQITYYYCGPAAVRHALSAAGVDRSQDAVAGPLGTTEMGTNSALDTTRVLNQFVKGDPYRTRMFPGTPNAAQVAQLRADVVTAITARRGVVANVAGDATDTDGGWHSFPGGHYIAVIGYRDSGRLVRIADSADPNLPEYWITTVDLANWIATRGYSA